jgi:electron transfer flavoprotein alpha subunit
VARERCDNPQDERKDSAVSVNAWIAVGDQPAIGNLITVARSLGGPVGAVVAGPRSVADTVAASGVDKVVWCSAPDDVPAEARAVAVADVVAAEPPRVVLAGRNPGDRVLLGAAAARLRAAVLTGARSVSADGDGVIVVNAVFGDIAEETVAVSGPVALLLDGGTIPPASGAVAPVTEVAVTPLGLKVVETKMSDFDQVDLSAAHRVIGVGRGLKAKEDLAMIEALASAAEAEVACSRPVAEGLNWMGKDRYIGSSGAHIAPQLYFAIGISGQLQHMVGVQGAETIVAINSDPNAAVFKDSDYGLVGDLYQLVPAITDALK